MAFRRPIRQWDSVTFAETARLCESGGGFSLLRLMLRRAAGRPFRFTKRRDFRRFRGFELAAFYRKTHSIQRGIEILSPLRLPVPPRPLLSQDQILSAFSGQV